MSRLFIELYLDEDVSALIADLLRGRGFDVATTLGEGMIGASDEAQLEHAVRNGRAVLTHNRTDFEDLATSYMSEMRDHCGIIIAVRRSPYAIVQRLLGILNAVTADEMTNQLRYI